MAEIVRFPEGGKPRVYRGYLEIWQDQFDARWAIQHISQSGSSAGIIRTGIETEEEAVRQARELALFHDYEFDGMAFVGAHP